MIDIRTANEVHGIGERYATVDILQAGFCRTVWVSRREWSAIANCDWIELDAQGELVQSFQQQYNEQTRRAMLALVLRSFQQTKEIE